MKVALFDVDGTLTKVNVWKGIMNYFKEKKQKQWTHFWFLLLHYPLVMLAKAGLIAAFTFRRPWSKHLSWYLKGLTTEESEEVWAYVQETIGDSWQLQAIEKLNMHKQNGDQVILVSGGPEALVQHIANTLNADFALGTKHEIQANRYTGRCFAEPCLGEQKAKRVIQLVEEQNWDVDWGNSFAYADAMTDLDMLNLVGYPIVVSPRPNLLAHAKAEGWQILESK